MVARKWGGLAAHGDEPYPSEAAKSTGRSPDNEGDRQGSPAVVRVVGGKTGRGPADRYSITSRPQGGGVCGEGGGCTEVLSDPPARSAPFHVVWVFVGLSAKSPMRRSTLSHDEKGARAPRLPFGSPAPSGH